MPPRACRTATEFRSWTGEAAQAVQLAAASGLDGRRFERLVLRALHHRSKRSRRGVLLLAARRCGVRVRLQWAGCAIGRTEVSSAELVEHRRRVGMRLCAYAWHGHLAEQPLGVRGGSGAIRLQQQHGDQVVGKNCVLVGCAQVSLDASRDQVQKRDCIGPPALDSEQCEREIALRAYRTAYLPGHQRRKLVCVHLPRLGMLVRNIRCRSKGVRCPRKHADCTEAESDIELTRRS